MDTEQKWIQRWPGGQPSGATKGPGNRSERGKCKNSPTRPRRQRHFAKHTHTFLGSASAPDKARLSVSGGRVISRCVPGSWNTPRNSRQGANSQEPGSKAPALAAGGSAPRRAQGGAASRRGLHRGPTTSVRGSWARDFTQKKGKCVPVLGEDP